MLELIAFVKGSALIKVKDAGIIGSLLGSCEFFAEMLERLSFKYLPTVLPKYVGEQAASALIFQVVREAARNSFGDALMKQFDIKSLKDALLACYLPYKEVGKPFEYEIVSEKPVTVRVHKCPHLEFTKERPLACIACGALKVGVIERITGKKVRLEAGKAKYGAREAEIIIRRTKHIPSGDQYCEFVVEER